MKFVLSLLVLCSIQTPLYAQMSGAEARRDIAISRRLINDQRNTALAFNMSFTQKEKEAFWPLYRKYRDAMSKVGDARLDVIVDYAENYDVMTQEKARELLDRSFIYEEQALKVKQIYAKKFRRILPDIKVTRLMQLENRMDAAVLLKFSEGIPLME
jgi:hypothetical protein